MRPINYLWTIMVFLVLLSLLLYTSVSGNPIEDSNKKVHSDTNKPQVPKVFDYGKYVEKFKKSYGPLETLRKAKLFFARTLKIFQHNILYTQKKVSYFLAQNAFTDIVMSELKKNHAHNELPPVAEALKNPNLPADQLASIRKLKGDHGDGFSQASFDDLKQNAKYNKGSHKVKPVLNFMDNNQDDDIDMMVVLREIKEMPDKASKVAQMIDLKAANESVIESFDAGEEDVKTKKRKSIKYRPVVESNNIMYEPQVISSQSFSGDDEKMGKNYAKYMMDSSDFSLNLAPYPYKEEDLDFAHETEVNGDESTMSKFFGAVKGFAKAITNPISKLIDDDEEEEEEEGYFEEDEEASERESVLSAAERQVAEVPATIEMFKPKYNIDWRQTGCISPVQNQKSCDSCYAFTVLGLMEYFHCRQTHQLTSFSAQYIIDCGTKVNLNGCRSSKISNVGQFIRKYGIELNAKYPYSALENSCPYNFDDKAEELKSGYLRPTISHWQNFQDMAAWYKWLRKSPVIVGISMPADFLAYGGGVHDGLDCISEMTHAMLLIGSGIQDGKEFWLLKNSYSEQWGEEGYFKLSKSAPLRCFNSAIVARAKFITTSARPITN